jgi:uncharacterized protein (TIGR00296 family)
VSRPWNQMSLSDQQGRDVVVLARETLEGLVLRGEVPKAPAVWPHEYLNQKRGVFVTLKKREDDSLRGCIGFPYPVKALGEAIIEATMAAAAHDPRFSPVAGNELSSILIEASVLTVPRELDAGSPLDLPKQVRIGVDGLIVSAEGQSGLLLPQVATEFSLSPEEFLSQTCMKAGLLPDVWLSKNISVQAFQAEIFSEESPGGRVFRELQEG